MNRRMSDKVLWAIVIFGIALMLAGVVCWARGYPGEGVYCFGLGLIIFGMFAWSPNRVLVKNDGIVLSGFARKRFFAYEDIDQIVWKCTGKILVTSYTGRMLLVKGGGRKILSKDEESLRYLNEVVQRAKAVGHSDRDGEIIFLR